VTALEPSLYVETLRAIAEGAIQIPKATLNISDNIP